MFRNQVQFVWRMIIWWIDFTLQIDRSSLEYGLYNENELVSFFAGPTTTLELCLEVVVLKPHKFQYLERVSRTAPESIHNTTVILLVSIHFNESLSSQSLKSRNT